MRNAETGEIAAIAGVHIDAVDRKGARAAPDFAERARAMTVSIDLDSRA